jgi:hypothetical protein
MELRAEKVVVAEDSSQVRLFKSQKFYMSLLEELEEAEQVHREVLMEAASQVQDLAWRDQEVARQILEPGPSFLQELLLLAEAGERVRALDLAGEREVDWLPFRAEPLKVLVATVALRIREG